MPRAEVVSAEGARANMSSAPALATLGKNRPGIEQEYADQDKPENLIHSPLPF